MANDKLFAQFAKLKNIDEQRALIPGARVIVRGAQEYVPVDTGNLRDSIHEEKAYYNIHEVDVICGNGPKDLVYAGFVEFGTRKMAAQPYVRPTLDNSQPAILAAVAEDIRAQMKKIAGEYNG